MWFIVQNNFIQNLKVHCINDTMTHCSHLLFTMTHCSQLLFTMTHCSQLLFTMTHCSHLLFTMTHCSHLLFTTTHCSQLLFTMTHCLHLLFALTSVLFSSSYFCEWPLMKDKGKNIHLVTWCSFNYVHYIFGWGKKDGTKQVIRQLLW